MQIVPCDPSIWSSTSVNHLSEANSHGILSTSSFLDHTNLPSRLHVPLRLPDQHGPGRHLFRDPWRPYRLPPIPGASWCSHHASTRASGTDMNDIAMPSNERERRRRRSRRARRGGVDCYIENWSLLLQLRLRQARQRSEASQPAAALHEDGEEVLNREARLRRRRLLEAR